MISELNYKNLNNIKYFVHTMIIFSLVFLNLTSFSYRTSSLFQILEVTKMSRMTKYVSKAGKVHPGDRVTLLVKFACKQELTLTRLLG